ncbi:MAG: MmgE/PrpD family protein [Planctomycetota bacterium]
MLTETLATFIVETGFDDIPQKAVERAKHHILDGIGVMLAGSTHPISRRVMNHVRSLGGAPQAGVVGGGFKTSAPQAAFVNGTMGHVLDFDDDSDTTVSHPTVTILPAVMALGENHSSGRQLLAAYIVGLEICARIAALPGFLPGHYERGWHATATLGVLDAVADSAKILDLDVRQVRSAFGIAASEAGGLRSNFGTMMKPLHAGSASAKGVNCALLAQVGITANATILECPNGFYDLYGSLAAIDASAVTAGLGKDFDIETPGMNIKKYPCCYYTHAAIDALLFLVDKHRLSPEDVRQIRCGISTIASDVLKYDTPDNGIEARFSMQYCMARALLGRRVRIEDFQDEKIRDEKVRKWMNMVEVSVEPSMDKPGRSLGARLYVTTADGQIHTHEIIKALGGCENPLSWEAVVSKFKTCASQVLDENQTTKVVSDIEHLENVESIDEILGILSKTERNS